MANKIKVLSEDVINKIAAGEVIERPASVVKELVENSIDAGSDEIKVKVENGGKDLIQVIDNGEGMTREDAQLALERHATSKITEANDLFAVRTLGFRGEALPSIAAVSRMEIKTRTKDNLSGTLVKATGEEITEIKDVGCPIGTNIIVADLFYNTPVRYKYLKTASTEISKISDIINRLALAYPEISFKLSHNQRKLLESPGNGNLLDGILSVHGKEVAKNMIEVDHEDKYMKVKGYVSKPSINRAARKHQSFFINRRYIKSKILSEAVSEAYHTLLAKERHPIVALKIKLNPILVDVNVHPTKMEVNFSRERAVFKVVTNGIKEALDEADLSPKVKLTSQQKKENERQKPKKKNEMKAKDNEQTNPEDQQRLNLTESVETTKSDVESKSNKVNTQNVNKKFVKSKNETSQKQSESKEEIQNNKKKEPDSSECQKINREEIKNKKIENNQNIDLRETEVDYTSDESSNFLANLFPLGQVHNTYIIARAEDGFYIIDQHAAHERIIYNQLLEKIKEEEIKSQPLLIPLQLELTRPEIEILKENEKHLENLGFEIDHFGGQTYLIRAVPYLLHELDTKEVCLDIIDNLLEKGEVQEPTRIIEDLLILISCHGALKNGDSLVTGEMEKLIEQLEQTSPRQTCPHGRPTMIHFSQKELAKKFKRN